MTTKEYTEAYKAMLMQGTSIEELNNANHLALETKQITLEQFQAAARVLAKAYLNRD